MATVKRYIIFVSSNALGTSMTAKLNSSWILQVKGKFALVRSEKDQMCLRKWRFSGRICVNYHEEHSLTNNQIRDSNVGNIFYTCTILGNMFASSPLPGIGERARRAPNPPIPPPPPSSIVRSTKFRLGRRRRNLLFLPSSGKTKFSGGERELGKKRKAFLVFHLRVLAAAQGRQQQQQQHQHDGGKAQHQLQEG